MSSPATRLLTLILLLQRRPGRTASDLAEALGVSTRTVHRYLNRLDDMGIPVYSERGPGGGFSLVRGYRMPPLIFTPSEAVAVVLGTGLVEQMWGRLYRDAARSALAKLENVLPDDQRQEAAWARRTLVARGLNRMDFDLLGTALETLREAMYEHKRVEMTYQSPNQPDAVQRSVDPYALVHRWGWWYCLGYCHLRQGVRTFRVDRIESLSLRSETFEWPEDFDPGSYLDEGGAPPAEIEVRLLFSREAAALVRDLRYRWDSVEEREDGQTEITFHTENLESAASWALSFSPLVEVLAPDAVRHKVCELAKGVLQRHDCELVPN